MDVGGLGINMGVGVNVASEIFTPVPNKRYKIVSAQNPSLGLDCSGDPKAQNKVILW